MLERRPPHRLCTATRTHGRRSIIRATSRRRPRRRPNRRTPPTVRVRDPFGFGQLPSNGYPPNEEVGSGCPRAVYSANPSGSAIAHPTPRRVDALLFVVMHSCRGESAVTRPNTGGRGRYAGHALRTAFPLRLSRRAVTSKGTRSVNTFIFVCPPLAGPARRVRKECACSRSVGGTYR